MVFQSGHTAIVVTAEILRWPYTYIYMRRICERVDISRIVEKIFQMCVHGPASGLKPHAEGTCFKQSGPELIQRGPMKIGLFKNIPVITGEWPDYIRIEQ